MSCDLIGGICKASYERGSLAKMARRNLPDLRNDPKLARFVVEGNATGIHLGNGSYGSVEEVQLA